MKTSMKRRFLLVGLTGGIGTGKSTVSRMFRDLGCLIIDADLLAREVVEPGEPAYAKIVAEFGKQVLDADGQIDRKTLGALVFGDEAVSEEVLPESLAAGGRHEGAAWSASRSARSAWWTSRTCRSVSSRGPELSTT